jgi:peptide chain release factor 2
MKKNLRKWKSEFLRSRSIFDLDRAIQELSKLESALNSPDLWNDPKEAQTLYDGMNRYKAPVEICKDLDRRVDDIRVYLEILKAEEDDRSAQTELEKEFTGLKDKLAAYELEALMGGEYDRDNAILSIHAGAGGTDSQDWVEMLMRMYLRWAQNHSVKTEVADISWGEEAGVKSTTILVNGDKTYGLLKAERGIHRLVRLSPFDAAHRRHTSFALVEVIPECNEKIDIKINPEDLKIDTFRSSGAGGQHVNKTDSAIRITHIPTGTIVQCQNERSQHYNRATAMKILKARLFELERQEQEKRLSNLRGEHKDIAWGNQIRSYVLHPYTLVKDHRTNAEMGNIQAVLDGDLDMFIQAYLEKEAIAGRSLDKA